MKDQAAELCNNMFKEAILDLLQNLLCTFFATKFSGFLTASLYGLLFFIMAEINFSLTVFICDKLHHAVQHFLMAVNGLVKQALYWESVRFFLVYLYGHMMELKKADNIIFHLMVPFPCAFVCIS